MKFVADVHVTKRIVLRLRAEGHEVIWMADVGRRLPDPEVMEYAFREDALILTFDKDYRYYALAQKKPALGHWSQVKEKEGLSNGGDQRASGAVCAGA